MILENRFLSKQSGWKVKLRLLSNRYIQYFSFINFGNLLYILAQNDPTFGVTSRTAKILMFFSKDFKIIFVDGYQVCAN